MKQGHKVEYVTTGSHEKVFLDGKKLENVLSFTPVEGDLQGSVKITLFASELVVRSVNQEKFKACLAWRISSPQVQTWIISPKKLAPFARNASFLGCYRSKNTKQHQ